MKAIYINYAIGVVVGFVLAKIDSRIQINAMIKRIRRLLDKTGD